jgi:hypothetical protein
MIIEIFSASIYLKIEYQTDRSDHLILIYEEKIFEQT